MYWICGPHCGDDKEPCFLGYDALDSGRSVLTVRPVIVVWFTLRP
jgi:hypothetical protein